MNESQIVTLRMPGVLKQRLEREAKYQGVSLNKLANYLLNTQITQLEVISALENRLSKKSLTPLKRKVSRILDKVPRREVPAWDAVA